MHILNSGDLLIPIFILCVFITIKILNTFLNKPLTSFDSLYRNSSIDGLRGILALSVFVHHFYVTYTWKTTGEWIRPNSNLMNNEGAAAVSFFFLITGYLFLNMLQKENIDWKKLYLSRIKRIMPLYYCVSIIVIIITLLTIDTDYSSSDLSKWLLHWATFRGDNLAGFPSGIMTALAHWTLIYEWGFYFSLPLIYAIAHKTFPPKIVLLITLGLCIWVIKHTNQSLYVLFALSYGAIHFKEPIQQLIANKRTVLNAVLPLLLLITLLFTKAYSLTQALLLAIVFSFVANGYNFFNLLENRSLKLLGDISYSMYLLHGLVLYIAFSLLHVFDFTQSRFYYYATFPVIFTVVILVSFFSYLYIERPFINKKPYKDRQQR